MTKGQRLPDFLIVGAMKAGTTTLFRWLSAHPECQMPEIKELRFFCDDQKWAKGIDAYSRFFAEVPSGYVTGEASPRYTHPDVSERTAERIVQTIPRVRLIFLVREPLSRLRSHYHHEARRGREKRPLLSALQDPDSEYVRRSLYWSCLRPYFDRFSPDQIAIVRSDDLLSPPFTGWSEIVKFLGLQELDPSGEAFNVTASKPQFSRSMLWLWERGMLQASRRLPRPLRRIGKSLLSPRTSRRGSLDLADEIPIPIQEIVREDLRRFETALGRAPLW